jgi:hypothetical protein
MNKYKDSEQKKPWYLLTGLILGILLGLAYSWWLSPVEYIDTPPSSLRKDYKDEYRLQIALSYAVNGDLERAKLRLVYLDGDGHGRPQDMATVMAISSEKLAVQAQQAVAKGRPETEAKALGLLASALGQRPTPAVTLTLQKSLSSTTLKGTPGGIGRLTESSSQIQPSITSSIKWTISPTKIEEELKESPTLSTTVTSAPPFIPLPSLTPSPTPQPSFVLKSRKLICDPGLGKPLLQIQIVDAQGKAVSGARLFIDWEGGQDTFITGLKPDMGAGYADYVLSPKVIYSLRLAGNDQSINDIKVEDCETSRKERYGGSWLLTFSQP